MTPHKENGETLSAEEIFRTRVEDRFFGFGERTPNRSRLKKGDKVVFYIGRPKMMFGGSAELSTDCYEPGDDEKDRLSHGKEFYRPEYGVRLENIQVWDKPRFVKELVPALRFIENKLSWNCYFQGGVRQVPSEDFRVIVERTTTGAAERPSHEDSESQSQFALENHLEDFMDENWRSINFGSRLVPFQMEDQAGRQFPAGPWSIDFLCTDQDTGDLVVIELKRGKSTDSTVGQLLRYIGWVRENLAAPNQKVRGVIIAKEVDEALRYAVKNLENVDILTYEINFKLSPFKK